MVKKKILVVEDETTVMEWLTTCLTTADYTVIKSNRGTEVIELVKKEEPDIILLDLRLPDIDGFTICKRLRYDIHTRFIPIILMSGVFYEDEDRILGYKSGANDFLTKPFSDEKLIVRIKKLLKIKEQTLLSLSLTGLFPETVWVQELTQKLNQPETLWGFTLIDIDALSSYNKKFGYESGDRMIFAVAKIMKDIFYEEPETTLFHLGSDNFFIIAPVDVINKKCPLLMEKVDKLKQCTVTVSTAVSSGTFLHHAMVIDALVELQKYSKTTKLQNTDSLQKSSYIVNRRGRKKVLVADDEESIRELLKDNLEAQGYEVLICCDGNEALSEIKRHKPNIVMLDLMMPGIDGYHLTHQIIYEETDISPIPKIIILSCRDTEKDKELGKQIGADAYITKPFKIGDVIATIKTLLE